LVADKDLSKLAIDKSKGTFQRRRSRRVFYWAALAVLLISLAGLYLAGVFTPPVSVQLGTVTQVYPSQAVTLLTASGYVVPQRKSALASKVTGRLVWLGVEVGSRVKKGDVVARLESQDVTAARNQAAANLDTSKSNLEQARAELTDATLALNRSKELVTKEFIARGEYDTAVARYKKAQASVKAAESGIKANEAALAAANIQMEYTLIRAPFDAVVLTKNADIGDIVTPLAAAAEAKSAVVTIADMDSLQVEADVAESNVGQVRAGQPCEIQLDALPERRLRGEVHVVVPTGDRTKATVMVKVKFMDQDPRILPEMSAKVSFLSKPLADVEQKPRPAVASAALVTRKAGKAVFLIREGRALETPVRTGERMGEMVEVVEGVKAGDQVVLNPPPKLKDGSKIKAKET
jgi:RND family efflux transporter MFP subunit